MPPGGSTRTARTGLRPLAIVPGQFPAVQDAGDRPPPPWSRRVIQVLSCIYRGDQDTSDVALQPAYRDPVRTDEERRPHAFWRGTVRAGDPYVVAGSRGGHHR